MKETKYYVAKWLNEIDNTNMHEASLANKHLIVAMQQLEYLVSIPVCAWIDNAFSQDEFLLLRNETFFLDIYECEEHITRSFAETSVNDTTLVKGWSAICDIISLIKKDVSGALMIRHTLLLFLSAVAMRSYSEGLFSSASDVHIDVDGKRLAKEFFMTFLSEFKKIYPSVDYECIAKMWLDSLPRFLCDC